MEKINFELNGQRYTMTIEPEGDENLITKKQFAEMTRDFLMPHYDGAMSWMYDKTEVVAWLMSLKLPNRVK